MMMPDTKPNPIQLSIVIPAPTDTAALEETLVSVLENRPDNSEIVVVLGCEYGDPWNIREEVRFIKSPAGSSLVGCINLGISSSRGAVIHVLASGWRATPHWTDAPLRQLASTNNVGAVIPLGVSPNDQQRVVSAGIRYSRGGRRVVLSTTGPVNVASFSLPTTASALLAPVAPTLEAGFWRADVLQLVGPAFSAACGDSAADADIAVSLACSGFSVVVESASRVVAPRPSQPRGDAFTAGVHAERLFWRSIAATPVLWSLVLHVLEIVRHAIARAPLGTLPMLAGRAIALLQFGAYVPRYRQLRVLRQQAAMAEQPDAERTLRLDHPHNPVGHSKLQAPAAPALLRRSA